jgi:hypothetical protein
VLKTFENSSDESNPWALFDSNIAALERHHPDCYAFIKDQIAQFRENPLTDGNLSVDFRPCRNGELNLYYHRREPKIQGLLYGEDPSRETIDLLKSSHLDMPQLVFFFGFGLGYAVQRFLAAKHPKNFANVIVEPDTWVFLKALQAHDFTEAFESRKLSLWVGYSKEKACGSALSTLMTHIAVSTFLKIVAHPASLRIHAEYFQKLSEQILNARNVSVISGGNSVEDSFIGAQNIIDNIEIAHQSSGMLPYRDLLLGKTILSVASGPSTDEHWEWIKKCYGKIPIIVCDSSLKVMLSKGIEPDFVTAIERVDIVTGFFKGVKIPERSALVGPLLLLRESIEAYEGEKVLYCPTANIGYTAGVDYLGQFFPGSSAGNLNLAFAAFLGCKNIIMVGHNLAFDPDKRVSHIKGTFDVRQETPYTEAELKALSAGFKFKSQDNSIEVYSQPFWNQFKSQIEGLISHFPEKRFINVAAKGAKIVGAEFMSFEKAYEEFSNDVSDVLELKKQKVRAPSAEEIQTRHQESKQRIDSALEQINFWLKEAEKLLEKFAKWREEIEQKESRGRKVSLHYLDDALEDVLRVKVKAVNEDSTFYSSSLSILTPAHLAFERGINAMPGEYKDNYELKRDFLLRHEQYFKIWIKWLPKIRDNFARYSSTRS